MCFFRSLTRFEKMAGILTRDYATCASMVTVKFTSSVHIKIYGKKLFSTSVVVVGLEQKSVSSKFLLA